MSKKKSAPKPAPKPAAGRVIDFNALLGNWPTITIGDQSFEGRHVGQTERARYREIERAVEVASERFDAAARVSLAADLRLSDAKRRADAEAVERLTAERDEAAEELDRLRAEAAAATQAQHRFIADALNARGATVGEEWVDQWPTEFLVTLVQGLHGLPWPGEEVGAEGK